MLLPGARPVATLQFPSVDQAVLPDGAVRGDSRYGSSEEIGMRADALSKSGLLAAVVIVAAPIALAALTALSTRLRG